MSITPRERTLTALDHRQADRIPIDFWATEDVFARLRAAWGLADDQAVLDRIGADLRYFNGPARKPPVSDDSPSRKRGVKNPRLPAGAINTASREVGASDSPPDGILTDHWGVHRKCNTVTGTRRDGTSYTWTYKHLHASPLASAATVAEIDAYRWPDADAWDYSGVAAACRAIRDAGYAVVVGADRLDRTAQLKPAMYLRGTEQFMADLILEPAIAEAILRHIAEYYLAYNERLLAAAGGGVDVFFMGDDMGTQSSTWVSPDMYRTFFKRRFAAYCGLAHRFGAKTMYHTCGRVTPLVADFIDAGLDILQSLQPQAMGDELAWLKKEFGRELCFQGGIDIQDVLPHGTPSDVAEHVRDRAAILGPGGGYIFGTAHNLLPDVPTENVIALVEAYSKYGAY